MDKNAILQGIKWENRQGIAYVKTDKEESVSLASELLYRIVDQKTCIFLSGGSTPKALYERLSIEGKLSPGALAMIDERYGEKFHEKSNEKMINETFLPNLTKSFYPILKDKDANDTSIEQTTQDYDETLRYLFSYFPKSVGILGIGEDGHTAGIPAIGEIAKKIEEDKSAYAFNFDDGGKYGKRITVTYIALARLDFVIILAFGKEKKKPLKEMFKDGELSQIPSRFYLTEEMRDKTILLTDQNL